MTGLVALTAFLVWLALLLGRGAWWAARVDDSDAARLPEPLVWPSVAALVPARDEAATVGEVARALLAQDYPGEFRLIVVDDRSTDGTGGILRAIADPRLAVIAGGPREAGWTGKLWALEQARRAEGGRADYLLLTDADIGHAPDNLRRLVSRAEAGRLDLVSLMAKLRCQSAAERWTVPAFVHFFAMLYPFAWSNDPKRRTAAAAGGCALLRRAALEARGGFAPIRGEIIDDCALARLIKRGGGRTWLGLTERAVSLRAHEGLATLRAMVARTAYAQLGYSPVVLAGALAGLSLVFLAPPLLALFANGLAQLLGLVAWAIMAATFVPMLRRYRQPAWRALALPVIAALYLRWTLDSALAHRRGRGGLWKGEAQAPGAGRGG